MTRTLNLLSQNSQPVTTTFDVHFYLKHAGIWLSKWVVKDHQYSSMVFRLARSDLVIFLGLTRSGFEAPAAVIECSDQVAAPEWQHLMGCLAGGRLCWQKNKWVFSNIYPSFRLAALHTLGHWVARDLQSSDDARAIDGWCHRPIPLS
jgi:hypothetical protein